MKFKNRNEAAEQLVKKLEHYKDKNTIVLAIPRGAVPMAKVIAQGLNAELGVILVHKISAPGNDEFAIGSVGLSKNIMILPFAASLGVSNEYIEKSAQKEIDRLEARRKQYGLQEPNYKDKIVIIVDDGIATGATLLSAIQEVKFHHPKKIIVSAAVSARDSAAKIRQEVDELVVLDEPEFFYAVGQFFDNFSQVEDAEVIEILQKFQHKNELYKK